MLQDIIAKLDEADELIRKELIEERLLSIRTPLTIARDALQKAITVLLDAKR